MIYRIITLFFCLASTSVLAQSTAEQRTTQYFESIKNKPSAVAQFIKAMPKGGDLHNHESGAAYAENLLNYAKNDGLCVNPNTLTVYRDNLCLPQYQLNNVVNDPEFYDSIIDAWSMRHFIEQTESGHDHFFSTFGKFSLIANEHRGEILAEIVNRAAIENESYLELMVTADGNASGRLGRKLGWNPDLAMMRDKLLKSNFSEIVNSMTVSLNKDEQVMRGVLQCDSTIPSSGCHVEVRYLYQVLREQPPEMVFAQLLAGFEGAMQEKRIVGINMVQPEDGPISMRDYKLHMQMIAFLRNLYPSVSVSLHAGELNAKLVPRDGLTFHISDAVNVANANRIGHGVDIKNEKNMADLLTKMAAQKTLVEINLSSNATILGIDGNDHPLPLYLKYGVPVTLSTDDEGISRSNINKEYQRAVTTFHLDYPTIKQFVRNSLTYAFIEGDSIWVDDRYQQLNEACKSNRIEDTSISTTCQHFLDSNQKAKLQWDLEKRFADFEQQYDSAH